MTYADQVKLCSVGSSLLSTIAEFGESSEMEQAKLVVRYLPEFEPSMSDNAVRFFEAVVGLCPRKDVRAVKKKSRREVLSMVRPH